jgi:hypothetical protein
VRSTPPEVHRPARSLAEAAERRRQVRGLLLLAFAILLLSLARAGFGRVFTPGWWRLW